VEGKRGERRTYTYYDLYREVSAVAAALRELGVEADDVVTIYLPKLPEVPITMLACARLGAVHNVVFAGFAPDALVKRMQHVDSSALVTCDGSIREETAIDQKRKADTALASLEGSLPTIVIDRLGASHGTYLGANQYDYDDLVETHAGTDVTPVSRKSTDPLFHIHTSGTTGDQQRMTHATGATSRVLRGRLGQYSTSPQGPRSGVQPISGGLPATPTPSTGRFSRAQRQSSWRGVFAIRIDTGRGS